MPGWFGWPGGVFRKPLFFGELRGVTLKERCDRVVRVERNMNVRITTFRHAAYHLATLSSQVGWSNGP